MHSIKMSLGKQICQIYVGPEFPRRITRWDVKRHCNAKYEFHVAMTGCCTVDVDGADFRLSAGDALLIAPGQYHCPKEKSDDYECFVFSFVIKTDSLAKSFYEANSETSKMRLSDFEMVLCNEIIDETGEDEQMRYQCINSIYFLLLSGIFKKLDYFESAKERNTLLPDRRLDLIDDFFEQNLAENATEEALANRLNLSPRQLNRGLQTNYGTNFRKKLCSARMNSAGWLLRTTNMTIGEIGRTVGYASETSFFKAFGTHYNMTPLQYRKKSNEEFSQKNQDEK